MIMRVLNYGKRLSVVLAGVFLGTSLGMSSIALGENVESRGFARPGINRPNINRPNFNRPAFNRPAQLPVRPNLPVRPLVNPIVVNPEVNVDEENVCVVGEEQAFLFINDECVAVEEAD